MHDRTANTTAKAAPGCLGVIIIALLLPQPVGCRQADRAAPVDTTAKPAVPAEVIEEFWPAGRSRLCREVVRNQDGSPVDHGTYTRWYQNGEREYEATYVRGRLQGVETAWHMNGQRRTEQHFDQGLRQGVRRDWDEQGHLRREEHYLKDRPHGTWTIWKSDGRIKWQARFDRGQPLP